MPKKFLLFIAFAILIASSLMLAQQQHPQLRMPSKERIENFKSKNEFNYGRTLVDSGSVIQRLIDYILRKLGKLFSYTTYDNFWKWVFIAIVITAVLLLIRFIRGRNFTPGFQNQNAKLEIPYDVSDENIHEINFDAVINDLIEKRKYRLALRYMYLKSLKLLSDRQLIAWLPDKTNHSYLHEISDKAKQQKFAKLTLVFENAWYGNKPVDENSFGINRQLFSEFYSNITN